MKTSSNIHKSILMIDSLNEVIGRIVAWCVPILMAIIVYDVAMRYLFQIGSVALQELEWHLFAIIFLLGAAYTFKHDAHVRVDIFYKSKKLSDTHRAWINIGGSLIFLIPFCILMVYSSWPFVENSYAMSEGSPDPGGLPYRFLLKAAIPLSFILLIVQAIANMLKNILYLKHGIEWGSETSPSTKVGE